MRNKHRIYNSITAFLVAFTILFMQGCSVKNKEVNTTVQSRGNTVGNIINNGLTALSDGWIYFSNTAKDNKLYKMRMDGTEKTRICDDASSYINVSGGRIYYRNNSDGGKIYSIRTDGTERTKINEEPSLYINVVDGWVYYSDDSSYNKLIKIKTDGTEKKVLSQDGAAFINVVDGWIYYSNTSDNYQLSKMKIDGSSKKVITKDMSYFLNVEGDWIYFSDYSKNFNLSKIKTDGTGYKALDKDAAHNINVIRDWIYFGCTDNKYGEAGLFKIKNDGTNKEKINNELSENINVIDEWVYFSNAFDKDMLYKVKNDGTERQNNDGVTVVRSIYDLNNALLGGVEFLIKEDKLVLAYDRAKQLVKELIKPGMTDLEKELVLHNFITSHSVYDIKNYDEDRITLDDSSAYGILVKGIGMCAGYAESMQLLLNLSGVECHWVSGEGGTPGNMGLHAWNIVKIDGEYYQLDATWDDPVPDQGNRLIFNYFNLPDSKLSKDHKWNKSLYKSCTSDKFSYFQDMDYPVIKDGWIYYSSIKGDNKLYRIKIDGTEKSRFVDDTGYYLALSGEYIYYTNYSNNGFIYRIKTDGSSKQQINNEDSEIVRIEDNWLYYTNKSILYRMKLDGSSKELVK